MRVREWLSLQAWASSPSALSYLAVPGQRQPEAHRQPPSAGGTSCYAGRAQGMLSDGDSAGDSREQ
jgi:hypothetical protein